MVDVYKRQEGDRRALESELGVEIANIFTIQEVKGLEFHYVFCYNLTGKYNRSFIIVYIVYYS